MIRVAIVARSAHAAEEITDALAGEELLEIVDVRVSPRFLPSSRRALCDVVLTVGLPGLDAPLDEPPVVALVEAPFRFFPGPQSPHATLPISARTEEIFAALIAAASGLFVLTADQALAAVRRPGIEASSFAVKQEKLTPRELEVLRMLADGLPNKAIAAALRVSDHTIKFHVSQILAKLNATSRTEAVTAGIRAGLLFV
ncbi:MAG: response regulator transcription factor [Bryobacteraceae bacterium]